MVSKVQNSEILKFRRYDANDARMHEVCPYSFWLIGAAVGAHQWPFDVGASAEARYYCGSIAWSMQWTSSSSALIQRRPLHVVEFFSRTGAIVKEAIAEVFVDHAVL